jgi:hypothetical protein
VEAGEQFAACPRGSDVSLVSTYRPRQNREVRRFGVSASAAALAVIALGFVAMQGTQRTLLESEGMKEYDLAQAKALLASDEVEVRNSERRLKLIRNKMRGDDEDDGEAEAGLSKLLRSKAEDYDLEADVAAANVAKMQLQHKVVPKAKQQQVSVAEEDDKLFARALRRAAERNEATQDHVKHMHLFLQQYGSKTQLKVGELKEEKFLQAAKVRMLKDRKHVESLFADQKKKPAKPETKVRKAPAFCVSSYQVFGVVRSIVPRTGQCDRNLAMR